LRTKIIQEGDITCVELSGYLDFEAAYPIADTIEAIYRKTGDGHARVVIDMSALEFVGSSGIASFVKNLRVFNKLRMKPAYFGVKSEFVKLFRVFEDQHAFEIVSSKEAAKQAAIVRFEEWQIRTLRSKRTH